MLRKRELRRSAPSRDGRAVFALRPPTTGEQIDERLDAGVDIVSATYVTPYPPGFPVLVPGQVFSREILQFMRDLDTPEIHGYLPNFGYRVYTEKAIETVSAAAGLPVNGHAPEPDKGKAPKKKLARRGNGNGNVPEVGQDELVGQQQPGDAITVPPTGNGGK